MLVSMPFIAWRALSRRARFVRHRQVTGLAEISELTVTSADGRPLPLQVDGDYLGEVQEARYSIMPDALNISARDTVLPVVPMFHVNAWGLPYAVPMTGAKMVFPGGALDGKSLHELFEQEGVTFSAGVPTVWLGLLTYMAQNNLKFSTFKRTVTGMLRWSRRMSME